jgi:hypothetical protein
MKTTTIYVIMDTNNNIIKTETGSFFESRSKAREAKKQLESTQTNLLVMKFEIPQDGWERVR